MRDIGERYLPSMKVNTIFMGDRLGRGGDHTPFQWEGFAAVRISTPNEIYANQHHATDRWTTCRCRTRRRSRKVNAGGGGEPGARAEAADRACPEPPRGRTDGRARPPRAQRRRSSGAGGGRRPGPMIARGGGYDAVLRWRAAGPEDDIKGYTDRHAADHVAVLGAGDLRRQGEQYTLKDVSIDDVKFGVKAIGVDGSESLVTPYAYPPRQKVEIETVP